MKNDLKGNLKGLAPLELKKLRRVFTRKLSKDELVTNELAQEVYDLAHSLRRIVGVLVDREGNIVEVFLGTKEIIYMPELGRYRLNDSRLRRLRLIFSDLSSDKQAVKIPNDILVDLEKLRFDAVIAVKYVDNKQMAAWAYNLPLSKESDQSTYQEQIPSLPQFDLDFTEFISDLDYEHSSSVRENVKVTANSAILIGVYDCEKNKAEASIDELKELARTAGVNIAHVITQRRKPDPKTLLGKGKLEEVLLTCLRYGVELIIFDSELSPSQWRIITKATDLKVIDRSMLILDIFAQRAQSSDGRLQVELAQLKYNLPRLVEKDAGLSRLTGGIGGRGPGETKLEIGRRRFRERINNLENQLKHRAKQRELGRQSRKSQGLKQVSLLGYTNVGKSTLFNALTQANVIVENKLFATLDSTNRKLHLATQVDEVSGAVKIEEIVIADTVGFIRDLPKELKAAFKATLEELYDADLLLHVVDISDSDFESKISSVNGILEEMSLLNIGVVYVLNKMDRLAEVELESRLAYFNFKNYSHVPISAIEKINLEELKIKILNELEPSCELEGVI